MYLIIFFLVLLFLLFCIVKYNNVLLTPQFGFVACFIPQVIYSFFYIKKWDLDICFETFIVLVMGVTLFAICSAVFSKISKKKIVFGSHENGFYYQNSENLSDGSIKVDSIKTILFMFFQIITSLLLLRFILSSASGGTLSSAIYYFRHTNLFTEDTIVIPSLIRAMRTFSIASGYIWGYLFIHSFFYKDRFNKLLIALNIFFSILNNLFLGARTGIVMIIVAMVIQYYFIRGEKYGWKKALSFNAVLKVIGIAAVFILTFQMFAGFMGRTGASNYTYTDYIAGYLCAEIKNLDVFISKGNFGATIDNNQTINGIVSVLAKILGKPEWIHKIVLPFNFINGYNYGNLYTIYYPFIHDLGLMGLFVYIPIMAYICQHIYQRALRDNATKDIPLFVICYSYIYFAIIFSFFSNKFFDQVANTKFIWTIASWYLIKKYIEKPFRIK